MRVTLAAPLAAAAALVPLVCWDATDRAPVQAAEPERPDRVFAAPQLDQLPFGQPPNRMCDCNNLVTAVLVQDDALWIGTNGSFASPRRIARDGHEWDALVAVLHSLVPDWESRNIQVAVHDDARYEDLLTAMLVVRSVGAWPSVIQPALPSYPNHGHGGGMGS